MIVHADGQRSPSLSATISQDLAASLAVAEKRTLVVDMDPQANSTSGFGIDQERLKTTIYQVMVSREPLDRVIHKTEMEFLDIAPSHVDLVGAEDEEHHSGGKIPQRALEGQADGQSGGSDHRGEAGRLDAEEAQTHEHGQEQHEPAGHFGKEASQGLVELGTP